MTLNEIQTVITRAENSDEVLAVIVAALLSAIGWALLRIFVAKAKIVWAYSHQHAFSLQGATPPLAAYAREVWIQNVGRAVGEDIEIIFSFKPQHYDVWPRRQFSEFSNPDGSFDIKVRNLNKREYVTIWMFQTTSAPPDVTNLRWTGGMGKQVPMGPRQIFPRWFNTIVGSLFVFGVFSVLYFLFRVIW